MNTAARDDRPSLAIRVGAAWLLTLGALALAGWAGEFVQTTFGAGRYARCGLQAPIMSGVVVPGILWLRANLDRVPVSGLGLPGPARALRDMALGIALIALPLLATVLFTQLFGWASVSLTEAARRLPIHHRSRPPTTPSRRSR